MVIGEIYIKLAVAYGDDPKVRALVRYGADAGLARDLYVQMICYCKRMLTDGYVPEEQIGLLVYPLDPEHGKQLAKQLAEVGLTRAEANGYQVLSYLKRNGTRKDVEQLSKVRAEAGRKGGKVSRKPPRQSVTQANSKQVGSGALKQTEAIYKDRVSRSTEVANATSAANGQHAAITKRSEAITNAYYEVQPMCKWTAVNGIVIHAIKTGKYADDQIQRALLRMAKSGMSVTIETLRVEIEGLAPRGKQPPLPDADWMNLSAPE
jgi:hypothetical protein